MEKSAHTLPTKPSALIRVALEDVKKILRSRTYTLNMGVWHQPVFDPDDTHKVVGCNVCLAGAVMVGHLGVKKNESCEPYEIATNGDYNALEALDLIRCGCVRDFFAQLDRDTLGTAELIERFEEKWNYSDELNEIQIVSMLAVLDHFARECEKKRL